MNTSTEWTNYAAILQALCNAICQKLCTSVIVFSPLPFDNVWQRKSPESQLIRQVQKDVWHSHYVLFPSLIKQSRVTMGVRKREVGRLRQNCGQKTDSVKLTRSILRVSYFCSDNRH